MDAATPKPLIAVIEDEDHLAQGLIFNLEAEGYRTHHESDGDAALAWLLEATRAASTQRPAAIVLDCMLPGADGFAIVRALREAQRYTPVLVLTARSHPEDVLAGLEAGADDYLPKPFDLSILLVRIKSLLRRTAWQTFPQAALSSSPQDLSSHPKNLSSHPQDLSSRTLSERSESKGEGSASPSSSPTQDLSSRPQDLSSRSAAEGSASPLQTDTYHFNHRTIRFDALELIAPNRITNLTLMEADLLRYLTDREGQIIPRSDILEQVWRVHADTDTRAIDNFIVRLRRYIEDDPTDPQHLITVRGVGYKFIPEP